MTPADRIAALEAYIAKLKFENREMRQKLGRKRARILELERAAETRKWIELDIKGR